MAEPAAPTLRSGRSKALPRWVALADVPDLDICLSGFRDHPSVTFRAGTDIGLHVILPVARELAGSMGMDVVASKMRWLIAVSSV